MRSIQQISCSLNLGLIYSLDYSYSPHNGISIKLFFVSRDGNYPTLNLLPLQKAYIQIGSASFAMYPVATEIELSAGRRIMSVEFVDDFFRLNNYYVVLPGRGCGTNVFTLGAPVDKRTPAQKLESAIDKTAQQVKELTEFPDYEYSFNDFLVLLNTKFNVSVNTSFNSTVTQSYNGSFGSVLADWCNYYNLSYFFENGILKIFDPVRLYINFPQKPVDAISYNITQDIRSTYGKTVCNWFQQNGGEYPLSQTSDNNGPLFVRTATLYPIGYEFNLYQTPMDLKQVSAAQYGQNYWFLYNYNNGTVAEQCGFSNIKSSNVPNTLPIVQSVNSMNPAGEIALLNTETFNTNFQAYQQYGQNIAGRWYLSERKDDIAIDEEFTWFNESSGQLFTFNNSQDKTIRLDFLTPTNDKINIISDTAINNFYRGINYNGDRIAYKDEYDMQLTGVYNFTPTMQGLVDATYETLSHIHGSENLDFSDLYPYLTGAQTFVAYSPIAIPQEIIDTFIETDNKATIFQSRFNVLPVIGISSADYTTLKASQKEPDTINIVNGNQGPTVVSNTSVLKTVQKGSYTVYYDKYQLCASSSTSDSYFNYDFDVREVSNDNQVGVTFSKQSNNTYVLNRDYAYIQSLIQNPLLATLAQPRTFATQSVTFTLNYFYSVPVNFLSNGLTSMNISVNDNGILASYTFSNDMLKVPDNSNAFNQLAQNMKNTWTRTYRPIETIT